MTEEEWLNASDYVTFEGPLFCLGNSGIQATKRKERLFGCACARRMWCLIKDKRARKVIEVGERLADGIASQEEHKAASSACYAAVQAAFRKGRRGSGYLDYYATTMAHSTVCERPYEIPCQVSSLIKANIELMHQTDSDLPHRMADGEGKEEEAQLGLLRDIFGNPFRPITINPNWLTPTVTNLATAAYEERALPSGELDTARLSILADALEEVGCDTEAILGHLRSSGPHFRGCHLLDLVLGRK